MISGKSILDILVESNKELNTKLFTIVDNGNLEGLKYSIQVCGQDGLTLDKIQSGDTRQYSLDFISKIGTEDLKKGYQNNNFSENNKIFSVYDKENLELFHQIIQYHLNISNWSEEEFEKKYYDIKNLSGVNGREMIDIFLGENGFDLSQIVTILSGNSYLSESDRTAFIEKNFDSFQKIRTVFEICEEFIEKDERLDDLTIAKIKNFENSKESLEVEQRDKFVEENRVATEKLYQGIIEYKKEQYCHFANQISEKNNFTLRSFSSNPSSEEKKTVRVKVLEGEPFQMLVHSVLPTKRNNQMDGQNDIAKSIIEDPKKWFEYNGMGNSKVSCSMINEEKFAAWRSNEGEDYLIFGFSDSLKSDSFQSAYATDAASSTSGNEQQKYDDTSLMSGPDMLMKATRTGQHNEIIIDQYQNGETIKPNYLVCYGDGSYISDCVLNAASILDIPIYVINDRIYLEQMVQKRAQQPNSFDSQFTEEENISRK